MASTNLPKFDPHSSEPLAALGDIREHLHPDMIDPPEQYPMYISCGPRPPTPPPAIIWRILAPLKKQQYRGWPNIHDPRMYSDHRWGAFAKLVNKQSPSIKSDELFFELPHTAKLTRLEGLPTELLDMIFEILKSDKAMPWFIFVLALTSKTMWNKILQHFLESEKSCVGCWAGTPLVCAAETMEDFPSAELGRVGEEGARKWLARAADEFLELRDVPERLAYYQCLLLEDAEGWDRADDEEKEEIEMMFGLLPKVLKPKIEAILSDVQPPRKDGLWMLRNLTEGKFVRLRMFQGTEWPNYLDLEWLENVDIEKETSLDAMLLRKICWSGSHEDGAGPKGEWAGHCFDIIEGETFEEEGWEDVTDSVAV